MIRPARQADVQQLAALGERLHAGSSYAHRPYDPEKVAGHLADLIAGAGVVFVAERDGEVIGGFAGGVTQDWFGPGLIGFDWSFYVEPAARHGLIAIRLLLAFEEWARAKGAQDIHLGITTGLSEEGTARLYASRGYQHRGRLFQKRL